MEEVQARKAVLEEDLTAAPGVFDQTLLEGCFDRVVTLSATEPAARDTLAQAVDSFVRDCLRYRMLLPEA